MTEKEQKSVSVSLQNQNQNERQFRCKCAKVYKSYPALYTHIKNKHGDKIEEFKNESKRPKEGEIDKGRPKKHRDRPAQADEQGDLLNIIELGILDIEQTLRNQQYSNRNEEKFEILQGNSKLNQQDLKYHYKTQKALTLQNIIQNTPETTNLLIQKLNKRNLISQLKNEEPVKIFSEEIKFRNQLIQHFNAATAAKILIQLELIEIEQEMEESEEIKREIGLGDERKIMVREGEEALWGRNEDIVRIIREIHSKWHSKLQAVQSHLTQSERNSHFSIDEDERSIQERHSSSSDQSQEQPQDKEFHNDQVNDVFDACIS